MKKPINRRNSIVKYLEKILLYSGNSITQKFSRPICNLRAYLRITGTRYTSKKERERETHPAPCIYRPYTSPLTIDTCSFTTRRLRSCSAQPAHASPSPLSLYIYKLTRMYACVYRYISRGYRPLFHTLYQRPTAQLNARRFSRSRAYVCLYTSIPGIWKTARNSREGDRAWRNICGDEREKEEFSFSLCASAIRLWNANDRRCSV